MQLESAARLRLWPVDREHPELVVDEGEEGAEPRTRRKGERADLARRHVARLCFSFEDYLALEEASNAKHEFLDGHEWVMASRSPDHGAIAAELAFFGSRVLHPATLLPAVEKEIHVRVLNTNRRDYPGTVIGSALAKHPEFTSIAYNERQAVLTIVEPRTIERVVVLPAEGR